MLLLSHPWSVLDLVIRDFSASRTPPGTCGRQLGGERIHIHKTDVHSQTHTCMCICKYVIIYIYIFIHGGLCFFFLRQVWMFFWIPGCMFSCFSAVLLLCFSASLRFCFSAFRASLLLCFFCFCAFLLLLFYFFFSSVMCFCCSTSCSFASLLLSLLPLCFFPTCQVRTYARRYAR